MATPSRETTLSSLLRDKYPPDRGNVGMCVHMYVYAHARVNGIVFSHERKESNAICEDLDES